jgi:hypothetical protein
VGQVGIYLIDARYISSGACKVWAAIPLFFPTLLSTSEANIVGRICIPAE